MNASPVVADGVVYAPGSGAPGTVHAVDAASGERLWATEPAGYATCAPALVDDTLYFGTFAGQFHALDATTGEASWQRQIGHRFGRSSPAVVDGTVYVATLGDGPLFVTGDESEAFEAPALLALDAETGSRRWRFGEFPKRGSLSASPAVADGTVYLGTERALIAVDTADGSELWRREIAAHSESSPAVDDGVVYYGGPAETGDTPARLWALDAATGESLWQAGIDDISLRTSPAVADGTVYVAASSMRACTGDSCYGTTRGQLYALDTTTGDRQWTASIETDTRSSPAVADGTVYVGCNDGLAAVSTTGETLWHHSFETDRSDTAPYVKSSPAVANGRVYVGASDGRLRAVGSNGGQ